jgi:hypothetical protein
MVKLRQAVDVAAAGMSAVVNGPALGGGDHAGTGCDRSGSSPGNSDAVIPDAGVIGVCDETEPV